VPVSAPLRFAGNVHGGVKVPGKPYLVMVSEGYATTADDITGVGGCPYGWLRMADISNPQVPALTGGEFKLRENDCDRAKALNGTFTSHNQTLFPDVALVPWYGGGLRIAPDACLHDGLLDLITIGALPRRRLLPVLSALRRGAHLGLPGIAARRVREITIAGGRPVPLYGDGEPLGHGQVTVRVRPAALRLIGALPSAPVTGGGAP